MEDLAKKTLLYDFYGDMLTERQKEIYEDYYLNDLSLGEIAEELSISRAAVHDNIKRSEKALVNYDAKLSLIDRYMDNKEVLLKVLELTKTGSEGSILDIQNLITEFIDKM